MIQKILQKLFTKSKPMDQEFNTEKCKEDIGEGYYIEFDEEANGMGGYCKRNVYLRKTDSPFFKHCIVNKNGEIQNFPGIKKGDWVKNLEYPLDNETRFQFEIDWYEDGIAYVGWTLQPDGRYFADEGGFGGENCEEIILYSKMNTKGKFICPFEYH